MSGKKENAPFGAGVSSLLMLFVVLCLTVFGVLTFMTARADHRLTQRSADAVAAYYQADAKAEELIAAADGILAGDPAWEELPGLLEQAGFAASEEGGSLLASAEIPVEGERVYCLGLEIQPDGSFRVQYRRTEDAAVWEDELLDVWDGK